MLLIDPSGDAADGRFVTLFADVRRVVWVEIAVDVSRRWLSGCSVQSRRFEVLDLMRGVRHCKQLGG